MKSVTTENGHWKICNPILELLHECRADEAGRYSLENIYVGEDVLVVTDGRRLVEVATSHSIPIGIYPITVDGYLLTLDTESSFPKYLDIFPDKKKCDKIVETGEYKTAGLILGSLIHAGCFIDLDLFLKPMDALSKVNYKTISVWVYTANTAARPFLLECDSDVGKIRYIQMPVNVENKV